MGTVKKLFENDIIRNSILDEFEVGEKILKSVAISKVLDILDDNGIKETKDKAYELLKMIRDISEKTELHGGMAISFSIYIIIDN